MIAEFSDKDEMGRYVNAFRERLGAGALDPEATAAASAAIGTGQVDAADPGATILAALPDNDIGPSSSGEEHISAPFFSRSPAVSLMQTSLEDEARKSEAVHQPEKRGGPFAHIVGLVESIVHPEKFGAHDPDWVTRIGDATLDRLAKGNHPFNPKPAEYEIPTDDARIVVVGDWGSGLPRAGEVAKFMAEEIADGLSQSRPVHVIHLGDVYYSGDAVEIQRRVLAEGMWPVTVEQVRAGVTSWSLNGNHDMYCGGWGYFDTLLRDERFANQQSPDGEPTSFFRIRTPSWDLVGLDTSWDHEVLSLGQSGVLADPQATVVGGWAAESERKLMLLSHHQLVSGYDQKDLGQVLPTKLGPLLDSGRVAAWLWGHEHRCMGFEPSHGVPYLRCIGHGGIPVPARDPAAPVPKPGVWQEEGSFQENDAVWSSFGFAVLDFAGPQVAVRYRDDQGKETRSERIG